GSLGAASNVTVGGAPTAVAVADLNGDGKLDLVVANGAQVGGLPSVAILLGTGNGSFGAATNFSEGTASYSAPWSVAVGDLNGDSKLDLLVVNSGTLNASILLGTGTGSFGSATNFFVGNGPFFGALGDFNSDGKLDLAVTYTDSSSPFIKIFLATGTGAFGAPTTVALPGISRSLAVADLNGDGKLDLAAAIGDKAKVSVLLGTGAGDFGAATSFTVGLSPLSIAVGDVNGDGKLDLGTSNAESNNISILLGTGTGSFGVANTFVAGSSPESLVMGDFNADLKVDLAVGNTNSNTVSILLNNGIPCVTPSPSPSPSPSPTYSFNGGVEDVDRSRLDGAHLILTGDTNNDGVTDITRSTTTAVGDHGLFNFAGLPAGTYILTVSADHRLFSPDTRTVALPTNFPNGSVTVTIVATSSTGDTPAGDDIPITIGGITLTFHRVIVNVVTTLTSVDPNQFFLLLQGL